MFNFNEQTNLWDYLKNAGKPIYIYGMGYGAEKIIKALSLYGLTPMGIFASDSFARQKVFMGYKICRFSEVTSLYQNSDEFIILLAFAAFREPLFSELVAMSNRYEMYAPDVPVVFDDPQVFTKQYFFEHEQDFLWLYQNLADDLSKAVFNDIINFKITAKIDYLTTKNHTDISEVYKNLICPTKNESYIDIGAYNGDTIEEFLQYTNGRFDRIIAVEPDGKNYKKMCERFVRQDINGVETLNVGIWDSDTTLTFSQKSGRNSRLNDSGELRVPVLSLDSIMGERKATIVKYDVEGAEYQALLGSKTVIMRDKPKLMVSAYHRNDDLIKLSRLIKSYNGDYKIYLRHHKYIPAWETNLYFI